MITIDDVREKLLTVGQMRSALEATEPLKQVAFPLHGSGKNVAKFKLGADWNIDLGNMAGMDVVDATVKIGPDEFALTKDAILEAGSLIGLPKAYLSRTPASLMQPHMNYWFSNKEKDLKLLAVKGTALAFTKATIRPFSNIRLVDEALGKIHEHYGNSEVLVDYKFAHTLRSTAIRLIVPEKTRALREDDTWSIGLQLKNSLVGETPVQLQGYLFCYTCTNGMASTHATSGAWNRKKHGQREDEVMKWAGEAVDDIFKHLDHEFDAIEGLSHVQIPEEEVNATVMDVFTTYRVPLTVREIIMKILKEQDDIAMYDVMQAIIMAANGDNVPETIRSTLMEIGGDIPRANASRCAACHRIQPA